MKKTTIYLTKVITMLVMITGIQCYGNSGILGKPASGLFLNTATGSKATTFDNVPPSRLWINLLNSEGNGAQAAIAYLEQTTTGLDYGYDAARFIDPGTIGLYSICEEVELVIQARPLFDITDTVVLGYNAPVGGTFTLELYMGTGVFENGQKVYIKDSVTNTVTEITNEGYVFETEAGAFNERFTVQYTPDVSLNTPSVTAENIIVASLNGNITIDAGSSTLSSATLYDINGRLLHRTDNINTSKVQISHLALEKQVVIVKIETTTRKVHTKKFVL